MDMNEIDAKVFTLITVGTTAAVQIIKRIFPKWTDGKEEGLAMLLPVLFTVIAKLANAFAATPWVDALLWAAGGGVGAGLAHDYVVNPMIRGIVSLFGKKKDAPVSDAPKE